ncbi:putative membrane protein [Clostridium tetanomorphum]|uniref:DUF2157 domain-containing protein n=1 Tax=Clostridium tetanomorphum TaxID=1553 RepID=UPI000453AE9E|nr:DUF2157 domain-containing protein [Clostridium tetanomorphum]KAJ53698.1 hypothetical protein CTM_00475 [Clostridium tetanomorphum DSM 665]MBP1862424.1 putative membrane protein [Clostridium tetanomorphum]NRS85736.1 putative membrane protein [Clostridium tetanomorphum]SQC02538.1 Uncharacterized membrane-anchored protein [Clostridium tetanomorphum]
MGKRTISSSKFNFLKKELILFKDEGIITEEQKETILSYYNVGSNINFIRVLLIIGSILIGLGILTFIASNWEGFTRLIKFIIVISLFIISNMISFKVYDSYPKTSKSFLYLSSLIYGSGIFLTTQNFNYSGYVSTSFLLWFIGVIPYVILFKDKILFFFSQGLLFIYINQYFSFNFNLYIFMLIMPLMYLINNKIYENSGKLAFLNNLLLLDILINFILKIDAISNYTAFIVFIIGIVFYYTPFKNNKEIFKIEGNLIFGVTGIILTYKYHWENINLFSLNTASKLSIIFSILFFIYLLILIKKGSLTSLILLCITILRFYFDMAYDFLPKSLFFLIGGIILLSMGYYFERLRKEGI